MSAINGAPESGIVHTRYRQYQVVGRLKPSAEKGTRKANIFKMNIFAPNEVVAKSRFWYYMSMLNRVKKANGEILQINEVYEKKPSTVATYGIWMRYDSRTGHHNMYREYRDTSINGAVSKMYLDVAARHRSRFSNVQIVRTATVPVDKMRKTWNQEYLGKDVAFPLPHRVMRPATKAFKKSFVARRPRTDFTN
jgi:large subunit ribosomal protein L18Ae